MFYERTYLFHNRLIETRVVFEWYRIKILTTQDNRLIETRVVFELLIVGSFVPASYRLIETRVVFEFWLRLYI